MADVSKIKLPSGTTYNIKDINALPLTGGSVTGPVSFGDSVSIDEATIGDLVVNGGASFTNNIQANTINGVTVGISPKFTDTVTTVTTSGSGNAVTAISASNGAITVTKGSTFLTGITSSQVTTALGYTPYNSTNPNGYTTNTGTVTKVTAGTGLSIGTTAGGNFTTSGTINHTNSVTAQTTQAVYPIKIDAQGHISAYGSAVTIPTVPSNIVNTITTTAGAHTAITSQKGNVSFNVPTTAAHVGAATSDHTHGNITNGGDITATAPTIASGDQIIINDHSASKITNGPTFDGSTTTTALTPKGTWESFAKSDTNTTYALSGALSSHKFTSTLTAGGSGSGTSTSDFTLAAGTGITITDDTNARKMTIACSVTNTDKKLEVNELTSGTLYYPVLATTTKNATRQIDSTLNGLTYTSTAGTTSTVGSALLVLGNDIAQGTANNEEGQLALYGPSGKYEMIVCDPTANRIVTLPDQTGTLATTKDIYESVELTQLEYDALSTTDKTDPKKVYFVKDADPSETSELLDIMYPIGSYYETADINFDPNVKWGGYWISETLTDNKIVEEGKTNTNDWTYRKWSSGVAECWKTVSLSSSSFSATGNVYYRTASGYAFPSNLFNVAPTVNVNSDMGNIGSASATNITTSSFAFSILSAVSTSRSISLSVYAIGTWKTYEAPFPIYKWTRLD